MPDLGLFGWIVVGLIAGALSGAVVGGRTARGCLPNIVVGIVGGVVGGWLAQQLGFGPTNGLIAAIVVATVGSILVRLVLGAMEGRT
ncbi:MAG TPA: GlsB/YeaQ/YmgE family stress response membrane protein [Candidatus Limnocylindrales bacterium]|nr:GlsB/YeaQ/YmgE family stress response membrane protein [Candidatus Limnocylindrales bacterium]